MYQRLCIIIQDEPHPALSIGQNVIRQQLPAFRDSNRGQCSDTLCWIILAPRRDEYD